MSRFTRFLQHHAQRSLQGTLTTPQPFTMELGSATFRLFQDGKVFFQQPSCLIIQRDTNHVIGIGQAAVQMIGKTPPSLTVNWPVRGGLLSEITTAQQLVVSVLKTTGHLSQTLLPFMTTSVTVVVPSHFTDVQQDMFRALLRTVQLNPTFIRKLEGLSERFTQRPPMFVIDVGAMTVECGVIANGQVITQRTILLGSEEITTEVITATRQAYQAEIGWPTAEQIKKEVARIAAMFPGVPAPRTVVRGRDLLTHLPKTFTVSGEILDTYLTNWSDRLVRELRSVCQDVPAEMLSQALSNGIFLTGGGSALPGLKEHLSHHFQTEVIASKTPHIDMVVI